MLRSLQVRNFAIIDQVEVDFDDGMTVLTGETGAGKSILVDALGLVLGERGGTGLVRDGAERADFCAEFDLARHPAAGEWLAEQALDADGQCVLRRVIASDGRSRAFINGTPATLQNVKALGELLVDIHGQHFHQSLGRRDVQRELLDHFGRLLEARDATGRAFAEWQAVAARLEELRAADADRASRIDLVRFQVGELDALDLEPDEYDTLQAERRKLQASDRIAETISRTLAMLYDDDPGNAHSLLAQSLEGVEDIGEYDENLQSAAALLKEAVIQVSEAADLLRHAAEGLEADPGRRDQVEERLDAIRAVARKHRVEPEQLPALRGELHATLASLENAEQQGEELAARVQAAERVYRDAAASLSAGRRAAGGRFAAAVTAAMRDLGMPDGVFEVELAPRAADSARAYGMEDVEYRLSANAGQAPMALARIASGGELSRMSLAIQVIASDGSAIPTMIFDEVDAGVGGGIAEMVGRRLHELSASRQVLCVTHLPQVASQADRHLRINKITDGRSTRTSVASLTRDERIEELARMLGGMEITKRTRDHAAEMLGKGGRRKRRRASGATDSSSSA